MANEIKLEVYTFKIRKRGEKESFIKLDSYLKKSFLDVFQDYINQNSDLSVFQKQKKSIQVIKEKTIFASELRTISGIIESGDYGFESKLVNKNTKKRTGTKTVDDLDIKPFYFCFCIPEKGNMGFIILQRLGLFGINSIFSSHLESFLKKENPEIIVEFNPFVSKKLAKELIERGNVKEFSLKRYGLPADIIDQLGIQSFTEDVLSIELRIVAKPKHSLQIGDKVKKFVDNKNGKFFEVKELASLGFDGTHKTSIRVKSGSNYRTIDLSETGQIRPYYDIDSEVAKDGNGHPNFSSIDKIAKELIKELLEESK